VILYIYIERERERERETVEYAYDNMDELGRHYAKCNEQNTERKMLHDLTYYCVSSVFYYYNEYLR
jgi:hypothetical protein